MTAARRPSKPPPPTLEQRTQRIFREIQERQAAEAEALERARCGLEP